MTWPEILLCHEGHRPWRMQLRSDTHGPEMSRRPRDCCRVPDLFVMQQPLAQLLTIGSTTISIPQSIQPRCQIMLCLLCFNNEQRLMMLMKKIGFGCPVPGLAEVLGSPRTCARRWCEVQQSSNIVLVFFLKLFQKKTPQKNGLNLNNLNVSICLNHKSPHSERTWELVKNVKTTPLLSRPARAGPAPDALTSSAWGKWVSCGSQCPC